jgi:peptide/nickel transport system substrate-binding protein
MKFRARHALIAAVAVSALALSACGTGDDGGGGGEDVPQTFAVSSNYPITSLDPYGQYSADGGLLFVAKQIYDTLIVSDGKGGYTGHLAESWEPAEDGKVWTFTLRDAKFSDGTPVTSADVKASIDAMVAGGGPFAATWGAITVATPDDKTVSLTSAITGSSVLTQLPLLQISPAAGIATAGFFDKPVGAGPFMVDSFTSDQELALVPNPNYWGDAPLADEVTIKTITDISVRITALLNGEVQAIWGVPDDQFGALESNPDLNTKVQSGYAVFTMWMNSQTPTLAEQQVRAAIWKAIDFDTIQQALFPYSAAPAQAPVSQAVVGAGQFDPYTYDPEEAKQMLADAGYPDGLSVDIQWDTSRPTFGDLAAAMKSDLAKIGVTLNVIPKEHAVYLQDLLALNFQINLQAVGPVTNDATPDLSRLYKCSAKRTGFCSDELDATIAEGDAAVDPADRAAAFLKVQQLIWENTIGMYPMELAMPYAWSKTLEGFEPDPASAPNLALVSVVAAP